MVYIDNFNGPFRRMLMCHMIADTSEELLDMALKIGVAHKWIQYPGTANEHFDVCLSAKKKAIANGAVEINMRDYARMVNERGACGKFNLDNLKIYGEKTITKIDPQESFKF